MTPPATTSPSKELTELLSLPDELLTIIILHLDKTTALSIALVCQRLSPLADHIIWRNIKLLVPEDHIDEGEDIAEDEAAITEAPGYVSPAEVRAAEAEKRYRRTLQAVVALTTPLRAKTVRSLIIVPLPGAVDSIVDMLRLLAPALESLTFIAPTRKQNWDGDPTDILDIKLHAAALTFPSLRFLTLGPRVTRYCAFGPYLASLAPHLDTLEYDAETEYTLGVDNDNETSGPPYPPQESHTSVTTLYTSSWSSETRDYTQVVPRLIAHLLSFPHLTHILLKHHIHVPETWTDPEHSPRDFKDIIKALGSLSALETLAWNVDPNQFHGFLDGEDEGFLSLRRLALGSRTSRSSAYGRSPLPPVPFSRTTIRRPSIIPSSLNLHASPHLAIIHHLPFNVGKAGLGIFDRLDQIDISSANGQVNSYLHNGEEALQTYLLNYDLNGWEHRSEFRGRVVPIWVFEEMRVVEGKSEEEWSGRGIEVGEEAWAILEGWYSEE